MKKIVLFILMMLPVAVSGQNQNLKQELDSLPAEQRELALFFAEKALMNVIDSLKNEGMFLQALDAIDSIQANWRGVTGRAVSPMVYLMKGNILMFLEE